VITCSQTGQFWVIIFKEKSDRDSLKFPDREILWAIREKCFRISRSGIFTCFFSNTWHNFPYRKFYMPIPVHSPESLGQAVRAARKALSLTQPQLALAAGVGVRFIVELEAGKPTLRLENILRVVDALGGMLCIDGLEQVGGTDDART
jgi:y4mF family transcriptional regulator